MTVGLVIVSHSAQLAAGVAELAGQMVQNKVPIAAAGGAVDDVLGTSVDKILEAIQAVDGPDGMLVLLDLGSALLSAEMALEMLDEEQRKRVRLSFAPLVEGAVAAALDASLGHSLNSVRQAAEKTAQVEQLRLLKPVSQAEEAVLQTGQRDESSLDTGPGRDKSGPYVGTGSGAREVELLLTNPAGLHARPASLFVQTAAKFRAQIQVLGRGRQAEASSIMEVLSLGARQGDRIVLCVQGEDADTAIEALSELVRANFYETMAESEVAIGAEARAGTRNVVAGLAPAIAPTFREIDPVAKVSQLMEGVWRGISTSAGVAIGPAFLYTSEGLALSAVERRAISPDQVEAEQVRLREALSDAAKELHALATNVQASVGQAQAAIFEAQALMVRDPALLKSALAKIEEEHVDAASALAVMGTQQANTLESLDDPLLAARAVDVRDAVSRAIRRLRDHVASKQDLRRLNQPVILVARDLTPSDTAMLQPSKVLGICTTQGGPTAHSAILARALGIPAIAGVPEAVLQVVHAGDELGLDADNGVLYHHPSADVRVQLEERLAEQRERLRALKSATQQAHAPVVLNGRRISLLANVGSEVEAEAARQWGAEGIGLLRTEFLFASALTLPNEEEQRQRYVQIFRAFTGASARSAPTSQRSGPIVVRTLDAGADKPMPALDAIIGSLQEENPALGLRGIRISLAHEALLEQQLSALLQAAAETSVDLHVMFPMITTVEELRAARALFDRVYANLKSRQIAVPERVAVGIMVEVPAAAMMAAELAELADFFSIGANDLLQYTLACDRTNAALAGLYQPMQPAVLRLIHQIAEAGRRAGKAVAVCGEMASDVRLAPVLVGLGVDELSMVPTAIPQVRTSLSHWSDEELAVLIDKISRSRTLAEVEQACADFQKG